MGFRMKNAPRTVAAALEQGYVTLFAPGAVIQDNDPRERGRLAVVAGANDRIATYSRKGGRMNRLNLSRIYIDGGIHHQGWSLVRTADGKVFTRFIRWLTERAAQEQF